MQIREACSNIDDDELARVRLIRDFFSLLWDMAVRPRTWDPETAKVSFGFYGRVAMLKVKRLLVRRAVPR